MGLADRSLPTKAFARTVNHQYPDANGNVTVGVAALPDVDGNPSDGDTFIYNSTTNVFEFGTLPHRIDEFTISDDLTDTFTLTHTPVAGSWNVSMGWVFGESRYSISGTTLTITDPTDTFRGISTNGDRTLRVQYDYSAAPSTPSVVRFYLPSTGTAPVSPAFSSGWGVGTGSDVSGQPDRLSCVTTASSTPMTDKACLTGTDFSGTSGTLARQYVSDPLPSAQTISGYLRGQIRVNENSGGQDSHAQMVVKVVSQDGATLRGTLLDFGDTSIINTVPPEFSLITVNRKFPLSWVSPGAALTSVDAHEGDRIVIEVGFVPTGGQNIRTTFRFGDAAASDLPSDDEASTSDLNPWVEFSALVMG